jgi:hypothetical protein
MAKGCVDVDYSHIRDAVSPFSAPNASTTKAAVRWGRDVSSDVLREVPKLIFPDGSPSAAAGSVM